MRSSDVTLTRTRLESFEREQAGRRKAAMRYQANLSDAQRVRLQHLVKGGESVHSQLVVAVHGKRRDQVIQRLLRLGIPCNPPALGLQTAAGHDYRDPLENTSFLAGRLLSLPIYSHLNVKVVDFICEELLEALA